MNLLRTAARLFTLRLLLHQLALAAIVAALCVAWLRVPDGRVLDVAASAFLAVILIVVTYAGETRLLLRIASRPRTAGVVTRGSIALLLATVVGTLCSLLLDRLGGGDKLRAGYVNSQLPASLRNLLSYPHLLTLQHETWAWLFWIVFLLLAMAVAAITVADRPRHAFARAVASTPLWLALSAAVFAVAWPTTTLPYWLPRHQHTLAFETTSLILRLLAVTLIDAALLTYSLCLLAAHAQQADATQ